MISKKKARDCAALAADAVWKATASTPHPFHAMLGDGMGPETLAALVEMQCELTAQDIYRQCVKRDPHAMGWDEVGAPMRVTMEVYVGTLRTLLRMVVEAEAKQREIEAGKRKMVPLPDRGFFKRSLKRRASQSQRVGPGGERIDPDAYLQREHTTPRKAD